MHKKKSLKDYGKSFLTPPSMDYVYFEHHEDFPFEHDAGELSYVNAWWLSEASFLVYCHPGFARMAWKLAGFPGFKFFQGKGTECMVAWNDTAMITSFRGTEIRSLSFFYELVTDFNAFPVEYSGTGKVHGGFRDALHEIWEKTEEGDGLKPFLDSMLEKHPDRPLWFCGHSLGGALAALAFTLIPRAEGCYIYGAPRIGNDEFVRQCKDRQAYRVEYQKDPIPMLPPNLPGINLNYSDLGTLVFIDDNEELQSSRPGLSLDKEAGTIKKMYKKQNTRRKNILGNIKGLWKRLISHFQKSHKEWQEYFSALERKAGMDIRDHIPANYVISLWNKLIDS